MSVIDIHAAEFAWPGHRPLLRIDALQVAAGESVFVSGPSGSGKSTLLALVAGIHTPTAGAVKVFGQDTTHLTTSARDRLRGARMGFVFQQFNLLGYLRALDNVLLPLAFSTARRKRSGTSPREPALQLLERLGLPDTLSARYPAELSVGQQQRVAVARALLGRPELVICDEPTSALDNDARDSFLDLLTAECSHSGAALLFVSHDRSLAQHFDRQLDMKDLQPLRTS